MNLQVTLVILALIVAAVTMGFVWLIALGEGADALLFMRRERN
jgi:hypothetical protein